MKNVLKSACLLLFVPSPGQARYRWISALARTNHMIDGAPVMRRSRAMGCKTARLGAMILLVAGCRIHTPVTLQITDAESGSPIRGAMVRSRYLRGVGEFFIPSGRTEVAGSNGWVAIPVTPNPSFVNRDVRFEIQAEGYLAGQTGLSNFQIKRLREGRRHRPENRPGPDVVVGLYAQPRPVLRLELPEAFRGVVKLIQTKPAAEAAPTAGQRVFDFQVPPSGRVAIPSHPLIDMALLQPKARTRDGMALPRTTGSDDPELEETVAFRWAGNLQRREFSSLPSLRWEGYVYVVGTAADYRYWAFHLAWDPEVTQPVHR